MKKTYFADYNFRGNFEIIFNDISLTKSNGDGVVSGIEYLNPYIFKSGEQTVTLIVKPLNKDYKIPVKDIKDYFIDIIYTDNGEASPIHNVKRCSFPPTNKPVDSLVYTWTFDADVPFEINQLSNAKNLTKEDPNELLQDVIQKYKSIHSIINDGKIDQYMDLYNQSLRREMISMYYDELKQKKYLNQTREFILGGKNHMLPLQNFKLYIHPNGKIVELEDPKGKPALVSEDDKDRSTYGLQLYRSLKTGNLEVY